MFDRFRSCELAIAHLDLQEAHQELIRWLDTPTGVHIHSCQDDS